eukprot:symbB.v1.2.009599.t1/scaffold613.1/size180894/7
MPACRTPIQHFVDHYESQPARAPSRIEKPTSKAALKRCIPTSRPSFYEEEPVERPVKMPRGSVGRVLNMNVHVHKFE